jgi:hypothetical protein
VARKPPKFIEPKFYLHYDEISREIFGVGCESTATNYSTIEISLEEHDRFVLHNERFTDYQVGYIRTADNKTVLAMVPKADQGYAFKNNVFEWIHNKPNSKTELVVEWNKQESQWKFSLSKQAQLRLANHTTADVLVFFVTLSDDFDFLINTIFINVQDLLLGNTVSRQFNSKLEYDIGKISIASKIYFQSYGLQIND